LEINALAAAIDRSSVDSYTPRAFPADEWIAGDAGLDDDAI